MRKSQLNTHLRDIVNSVLTEFSNVYGIKNRLLKAIIHSNSIASISRWINSGDDPTPHDLGLIPLERIAKTCDYELHLAFVHKDDIDSKHTISNINYRFFEEFEKVIKEFVNYQPEIRVANSVINDKVVEQVICEIIEGLYQNAELE